MRVTQAPVPYNFFPNAASGQKILEATHNLIYLQVTVDVISTLLTLVDGSTRKALGFAWRGINYTFHTMNVNSMYVQYKVNVSENQLDTLKDTIRLKNDVISIFQKVALEVIMSCCLHQYKLIN